MEQGAEHKKKIFIIDDDNFLLDMYVVKFKERGFDVSTSLDTKEALTKLREGLSPDIILLDIVMPGIDGLEFLEIVRKENLAGDSLKIILSNQWEESDIKKAKELGADDYIVKANVIPSEVLEKVEEAIKKRN